MEVKFRKYSSQVLKNCHMITCTITAPTCFPPVGGDDSEEEEEFDSNNDGGSLQSERTDKDEEACEG